MILLNKTILINCTIKLSLNYLSISWRPKISVFFSYLLTEFWFARNSRGFFHMVYKNHLFSKDGSNKMQGKTFWRCVQQRQTKCKARCILKRGVIIKMPTDHNHKPDPSLLSSFKACNKVLR